MYLLVICEILGRFVNTFITAKENLQQPIQMQLNEKRKSFFLIFCFISEIFIKF